MAFRWLKDNVGASKAPKEKYSLEMLQYLVGKLKAIPVDSAEHGENKEEIVESLRMMAELIIWGDQNNSSVLDYCLENNVLEFFLNYLKNTGKDVQVQLLQTLAIMLQNLKNNAYIYYMLSQNHLNSLITHKFDFDDEELVGLYISLVKTIALKLDAQTVQFFFNKRSNNMPLLTEIIKFYANSDRNARIAVRTITLQVFRVDEPGVEKFVLERCAVPYFSNLVWFMREQCTKLDRVFATASTKATGELESLAAEHLDRLFYLSDVFDTCKEPMCQVVYEQMLFKLLLPRAVASVVPSEQEDMLSPMMAMMFLAQTMFIFSSTACVPLINAIGCALLCESQPTGRGSPYRQALFAAMEEEDDRVILASLAVLLSIFDSRIDIEILERAQLVPLRLSEGAELDPEAESESAPPAKESLPDLILRVEKGIQGLVEGDLASPPAGGLEDGCPEVVVAPSLEPEPEPKASDTAATLVSPPAVLEEGATATVEDLLDRLIMIIERHSDNIRICVMQMAMKLILALRQRETTECLLDLARMDKISAAMENAGVIVGRYLDSGCQWANSIFVFMREELTKLEQRKFNFEHTVSDPVTMLPLDQERNPYIDLNKRLPASEEESVRRDIRAFLLLREFVQTLRGRAPAEGEDPLPLSLNQLFMTPRFKEQEAIDLSTRISTEHWKTSCACGPKREMRYLLITDKSVLIVEPDLYRMDYAVVHHACSTLQIQSAQHNFDSQRLHMEAKSNNPGCKGLPAASWSVVLIFNTAEQCLAARQYLEKARLELLDKRAQLVSQVLAGVEDRPGQEESTGEEQPKGEDESKAEEDSKEESLPPESVATSVAAPETDAPPVEAPAVEAAEGDEANGD